MTDQVKTSFLLLSDTHAHAPSVSTDKSYAYRWPLPAADVAIHTGDLTMNGTIFQHEQAVDMLRRLPAYLKIVIPGNHDLTLDQTYYSEKGYLHGPKPGYDRSQLQYIRNLYTGPEAQAANISYLEEGTQTFQLRNGARLTVYASAYTPEFCGWAFAYPREQDRFNDVDAANPVQAYTTAGPTVDVMLTHGPPFGILDKVDSGEEHVGCGALLRAVARAKPLLHCFGHIHEGWGVERAIWAENADLEEATESKDVMTRSTSLVVDTQSMVDEMGVHIDLTDVKRGDETVFVNSSIMDVNYAPVQGPFVVHLMLDKIANESNGEA